MWTTFFAVPSPTEKRRLEFMTSGDLGDTCVCVCVCPTLDKGFSTTFSPQAGGMAAVSLAMPTKLWDSAGRECGRTFLYLQRELLIKLSNSTGLFPWSFMVFFPPNLAEFLCSLALQPTRSAPLVSADLRKIILLKHLQVLGLFAILFHRHPSHRRNRLTEYKCQSVFCSAVPLGC